MSGRHPLMSLEAPPLATSLIEGLLDAVWLVNAQNLRVVAANAAAGVLFRVDPLELSGRHAQELCASPEDMAFWQEVGETPVDGPGPGTETETETGWAPAIESETLIRRFDGSTVPVLRRVRRLNLGPGQQYFMVALHDRSEQQRIENELEERLAELAATLDSTADGILVTDLAGRVRNFNKQFVSLWSVPTHLQVRGNDAALLGWMRESTLDPQTYDRELARVDDATRFQTTDTVTLRNGRVLEREALPQRSRGRPIGRVFSFRDITERVESRRRIDALSSTDALTGLPNRGVLDERAAAALLRAQRDNTPFALMMVDLDHFKHINDTLGHGFGDRVLVEVAERLKGCLRQLDTVARLGGDEFIMLVHQVNCKSAEATGRRVLQAMVKPFRLGGITFTVTCSIGVAVCPDDGLSLEELLRRASLALQAVKEGGRAGVRLHQPVPGDDEAQQRLRHALRLDHAMRQALAENRFRLHYQPQVDLRSGRVLGAEALLRWHDPELGHVPPAEFIPVAEESGFIVAIGDWVLHQAVRQAAQWHAQGRALVVSINVSAVQFHQPGFVDGVAAALHQAQLPPQWLELELTESILIQHAQEALERLQSLARLGVKLAIDDFGTGYSSLGYLKRLPISRLKIDRSFLRGLPEDQSDVGIVNAVINLGRALDLRIVAEGVETETQRQFLEDAGCEQYQGFLFAPALDVPSFTARLDSQPEPAQVQANPAARDTAPDDEDFLARRNS